MEKRKAEQAKKKADKAKGIEAKKEATKPPAKSSQEERFRRASLVVDVAAMANFEVRGHCHYGEHCLGERSPLVYLTRLSSSVCQDAKGPAIPEGDAGGMTFAARRQSVLASTGPGRRASLIAGAGNVMSAMGGGSEQDLMAAAVAAIDMEDTFEDAQVAVRRLTTLESLSCSPATACCRMWHLPVMLRQWFQSC
jgi:hypothetical protein